MNIEIRDTRQCFEKGVQCPYIAVLNLAVSASDACGPSSIPVWIDNLWMSDSSPPVPGWDADRSGTPLLTITN